MPYLPIPKKETVKWTGILFIAFLLLFTGYSTLNLYDSQYKIGSNIVHQDSSNTGILNHVNKTHTEGHPAHTNQQISNLNLDLLEKLPDFSANFNFKDYVLNQYPEYLLKEPKAQQPDQNKKIVKNIAYFENKAISTTDDISTPKKKVTHTPNYQPASSLSDIDVTYLISENLLLQDERLADQELKLAIVRQPVIIKSSSKSIQQAGIKNAAIIVQTQNTLTNNTSTLQIGKNNNSLMEQYSGSVIPTSTAHIEQMGDDNLAWQEQYQWSVVDLNQAEIQQSGAFNVGWQRQYGWAGAEASSTINQQGNSNFAQTSQSGSDKHLKIQIWQQGSGNRAFVTQHSF